MPKQCTVTIEGVGRGILFNNPAGMLKKKSATQKIYSAAEDANQSCYWNKDKTELCFPGDNMKAGLRDAAVGLKVPAAKKQSLKPIICGDVSILEDLIGFGTNQYEIDTRRCVLQRQGILRSRAKLPQWRLTFTLQWETSLLGDDFDESLLPILLTILGERIGIGDFRISHGGSFGKFRVVEIKRI